MSVVLTEMERHLLEMLAEAGKPTELGAENLALGNLLEQRGLVFFGTSRPTRTATGLDAPLERAGSR